MPSKLITTGVSFGALLFLIVVVPLGASAGNTGAGKAVYTTNCAACHGDKGDGQGPVGVTLQPPPRDFSTADFAFDTDGDGQKGTDADLVNVIKQGAAAYGGSPLMAPFAHLADPDIQDVIAYIRTLGL